MRRTPVSVKCDHPLCPEVQMSIAMHEDDSTPLPTVRAAAALAAADAAAAHGWRIERNGTARCPLHKWAATPILLPLPTTPPRS